MATAKIYEITYLDNSGKKQVTTTNDIITFYQKVRKEDLNIVKVKKQ